MTAADTFEKPKSLVTKLCEVMAATERVPKNGWNDFHKYHFARESDIVESIRGELAARNIFIFPTIESHERMEYKNQKGNTGYFTTIMVGWTIRDGNSDESFCVRIPGTAEDSGDKGFYKAFTGSEKYMLTKMFLIPTGDDPENDEKAPGQAYAPPGREIKLHQPEPQQSLADPNLAPPNNDPSDSFTEGRIGQVTMSADNACGFLSIGDMGVKGAGTIWTRDKDLIASLVKSQGQVVVAHLRSKTAGKYQVISFVPTNSQPA